MNAAKTRLGVGVAVGCALVVAAWQQSDVSEFREEGSAPRSGVELARLGERRSQMLEERATLFDPAPVFVPTMWNASTAAQPDSDRGASVEAFADFAAKLGFPTEKLVLPAGLPFTTSVTPVDVLRDFRTPAGLGGFGRRDEPLTNRGETAKSVMVEVFPLSVSTSEAGRSVSPLWREWFPVPLPEVNASWAPMDVVVSVSGSAEDARPMVVAGSGLDGMDDFMLTEVFRRLRWQWVLPPGLYRIQVGP